MHQGGGTPVQRSRFQSYFSMCLFGWLSRQVARLGSRHEPTGSGSRLTCNEFKVRSPQIRHIDTAKVGSIRTGAGGWSPTRTATSQQCAPSPMASICQGVRARRAHAHHPWTLLNSRSIGCPAPPSATLGVVPAASQDRHADGGTSPSLEDRLRQPGQRTIRMFSFGAIGDLEESYRTSKDRRAG